MYHYDPESSFWDITLKIYMYSIAFSTLISFLWKKGGYLRSAKTIGV